MEGMNEMHAGPHEHGWDYDRKAMMMFVVKKAKFELLKEKVKKRLEEKEGKQLDEMADILVEARLELKKAKREFWKKKMQMKERMMELFEGGEEEEE